MQTATASGPVLVDLVEVATGTQITRYAVDARELMASGSYVLASSIDAQTPSAGGEGGGSGDATDGDSSSAAESNTDGKKGKK